MKCEYCENEVPAGMNRCPSCGAHVENRLSAGCDADALNAGDNTLAAKGVDPLLKGRSVEGAGKGWVRMQLDNIENDPRLEESVSSVVRARWAYVVLAVFLGVLGVHNFYAGYIMRGLAQLAVTILTCGWLGIVVFVWALIEAIAIRRDADGVPFE